MRNFNLYAASLSTRDRLRARSLQGGLILRTFATRAFAMQHLTPKEAYEFLQRNPSAVFVDCRSEMEFLFVGHPTGVFLTDF